MSDNKPRMPYFKVFPSEELLDYRISQLTLEEFGAYQKLKFFLWNEEKLPLNFKILGKLLGISSKKNEKLWENLKFLFVIESENEEFIRHLDLDEQRHNYTIFIEKSRLGGQKSAERRGKVRLTDVTRVVEPKDKDEKKIHTTQQHSTCAESPVVSAEFEITQKMRDDYFESCVATGTIRNEVAFRNYTNSEKSNLDVVTFHQSKNKSMKPEYPKEKLFVCSNCGSDEIGVSASVGAYCRNCPDVFSRYQFVEKSNVLSKNE